MKRESFSLKYMLLTCRLDMLWLPAAFWALFLIIAWMIQDEAAGFPVTVAFLGAALPLISGILAAYAVLEDPALELQFAAPRPAWRMLLERLGMILLLAAACALSYQGALALLGIDLSPLGGFWPRQLAWLAPTLATAALGSAAALANRNAAAGAAAVGLVWMLEIMLRGLFLQSRWARYLLLMMGSNYPDHPALRANQAVLAGLAALLLAAAWALLRRQERYI
jgi:hypothetical protein